MANFADGIGSDLFAASFALVAATPRSVRRPRRYGGGDSSGCDGGSRGVRLTQETTSSVGGSKETHRATVTAFGSSRAISPEMKEAVREAIGELRSEKFALYGGSGDVDALRVEELVDLWVLFPLKPSDR